MRSLRRPLVGSILSAALAAGISTAPAAAAPHAAPTTAPATSTLGSGGPSRLVSLTRGRDRAADATVHSAAMNRDIALKLLIPPGDTPRPTVYVLDGVGGASPENGVLTWGRAASFYRTKDVNVVAVVGGDSSYFTDWKRDDPKLGRNKWATFLTQELPPIVDATLPTTGRNALVGVSMSGTSSLALAIRSPGLYQGVAAFSGCARTSDPLGRAYVNITVNDFGGTVDNMWGPPSDPLWVANDPYLHADKLRGTALYISSGSGLPGRYDNLRAPNVDGDVAQLIAQLTLGGVIEAATRQCSVDLQRRLTELKIPATYDFPTTGTHSWDYWHDAVVDSWPVLARSVGADPR